MSSASPPQATVLVVDDEWLIRWSLGQVLSHAGLVVLEAEGAGEALARFAAREDIAVVLLDLKLPDGDGRQVLERIHADRPRCAVIVMSAHGSAEDEQAVLASGAVRYVAKPFRSEEMLAFVKEALAAA
jgi:DNA-binding NtrC family response regulator